MNKSERRKMHNDDAGRILELLSALENYPEEALAPYKEFRMGTNTYYFTPGGSLYRKDSETEEEASNLNTILDGEQH